MGSKITHLYWNRQHNQNSDPDELSWGRVDWMRCRTRSIGEITTGALSTPTVQTAGSCCALIRSTRMSSFSAILTAI